jgi:hypothetical protein
MLGSRVALLSAARSRRRAADNMARNLSGAPMNEPDKSTFYGGGAKGYTDYPTLAEKAVA